MDADLDRILDDGFLKDVDTRTVPELRDLRASCQAVEGTLSYLRRLVQGRHDIVAGEVARRLGGGDPDDVQGLVERLPQILSDRVRGPRSGRRPADVDPDPPSGRLFERLDAILAPVADDDSSSSLTDDDLRQAEAQLRELEGEVSALRRRLFERIDTIEEALTERYASGEAKVDDLLAPDRGADAAR